MCSLMGAVGWDARFGSRFNSKITSRQDFPRRTCEKNKTETSCSVEPTINTVIVPVELSESSCEHIYQ